MSFKKKIIALSVWLSRIIVGVTFTFSGFVKAVDPLGFCYKIQDYLIEFDMTAFFPTALPLAILLSVAEFLLGIGILLGLYRKWTTIGVLLFMVFFTPLTLWIALANPVEDCGCFGDAFIISNWATFYKNVVLLAAAILLVIFRHRMVPLFSPKTAWIAALFCVLFGFGFALYNSYTLPVFDFRAYKIGADIPRLMEVDPEEGDVYETVFIYRKDGKQQTFSEENYPWNDSTWTFVDMETRLIKEGVKPAIEDFAVEMLMPDSLSGQLLPAGDITQQILTDSSYTFLMIAYDLEEMHLKYLGRFSALAEYASDKGYSFYCLTSSSASVIDTWSREHKASFSFAHADERMLKTMIRSNPGLLLLKNGVILHEWDDRDVPSLEQLPPRLEEASFARVENTSARDRRTLAVIILLFIVPLVLIKVIDRTFYTKKYK